MSYICIFCLKLLQLLSFFAILLKFCNIGLSSLGIKQPEIVYSAWKKLTAWIVNVTALLYITQFGDAYLKKSKDLKNALVNMPIPEMKKWRYQ